MQFFQDDVNLVSRVACDPGLGQWEGSSVLAMVKDDCFKNGPENQVYVLC